MQQYLIPTPEGEIPDLQLVALVLDGEVIPIANGDTMSIITVAESEETSGSTSLQVKSSLHSEQRRGTL